MDEHNFKWKKSDIQAWIVHDLFYMISLKYKYKNKIKIDNKKQGDRSFENGKGTKLWKEQ